MDIFTFFILLLLALGVSLIITRPFFEKPKADPPENPKQADLRAEYERLLSALQELDFDNNLGKIPVEEYEAQRNSLLQAAAEVMKSLEELKA